MRKEFGLNIVRLLESEKVYLEYGIPSVSEYYELREEGEDFDPLRKRVEEKAKEGISGAFIVSLDHDEEYLDLYQLWIPLVLKAE